MTTEIRKIAILGNLTKPLVGEVCRQLIDFAHRRKIRVVLRERMTCFLEMSEEEAPRYEGLPSECDLVVTLGGDGTLLHAVRMLYPLKALVLAVNMGNLGFNTQATPDTATALMTEAIEGRATWQERTILEMSLVRHGETVVTTHALNDVLLQKTMESRIVHLDCLIGGKLACRYIGDGLVLSTPTGSTAYNLSVGGPIIHPSLNVISLAPLCPTRHGVQPLVVPGTLPIAIRWRSVKDREQIAVNLDGQDSYFLENDDQVLVRAAPFPLRLLMNRDSDYFEILSRKIGWGGLPSC